MYNCDVVVRGAECRLTSGHGGAHVFVRATIGNVPNAPKTPHSSFRIPADLKAQAAEKAKAEGKDLTQVVVEGLQAYLKRKGK